MKNLTRSLFVLLCFLALAPVVLAENFTDVDYDHLYFTAIDYVKADGIVQGYDDGTYKPEDEINRAEFTKIIIEATFEDTEIENCAPSKVFSDIPAGEWYEDYVCVAVNNGIIDGYPDGTFKGGDKINFVEAAKIIVIGFEYDTTEGGEWYEPFVKVLEGKKAIPVAINALVKQITRGEMAEMIWRLRNEITQKTSSMLIVEEVEPITPIAPITPNSSDYPGWATYSGDGFAFYHPNWYQGVKWGYDTLSPEYDFIFGDNNDAVDVYVHAYTKAGSTLETDVWFDHPLVSSEYLTINGLSALKRHYRAPRGTVVNGRTTGEDENIYVYSYKLDGKVGVLQYFNAYGTENKNVDIFYDIAESFYQK